MLFIKKYGFIIPILLGAIIALLAIFAGPTFQRWIEQRDLIANIVYSLDDAYGLIEWGYNTDALDKLDVIEKDIHSINSNYTKTKYLCVVRINKGICHLRIGINSKDRAEIEKSIQCFNQIFTLPEIEYFPNYSNEANKNIRSANLELNKI